MTSPSEQTSTMSADDARDRFGDVLDGALPEAERVAFDAALAGDAELREEFEAYRAIVQGVAAAVPHVAGADEGQPADEPGAIVAPSLAPRVQDRIRKRSKGRYFRDRFSRGEVRGGGLTALLVTATFLLLVAVWLMLDNVSVLDP